MKYNDIPDVETEVTKNEFVTVDIKPKRKISGFAGKLNLKKFTGNKFAVLMLPLLILTAVSIGFLISQIAEISSLTEASALLSTVLK